MNKIELELLTELVMEFKDRFAPVAYEMMTIARARGISEQAFQAALSAECLKLAAQLHVGTTAQFVRDALRALEDATAMPNAEAGLQ